MVTRRMTSGLALVPDSDRMAGGLARQLGERLAVRGEQLAQVGGMTGQLRRLRLAETGAGREQPVERLAVAPVQLVDHPGRHRRFGQRFHGGRGLLVAGFLEPGGQGVPGRRELGQRQLEQRIYLGILARHE